MDFGRIGIDSDLVLYLFGTPGAGPLRIHVGGARRGHAGLRPAARRTPGRIRSTRRKTILAAFRKMAPGAVRGGSEPQRRPGSRRTRRGFGSSSTSSRRSPIVPCDATDKASVKDSAAVAVAGSAGEHRTRTRRPGLGAGAVKCVAPADRHPPERLASCGRSRPSPSRRPRGWCSASGTGRRPSWIRTPETAVALHTVARRLRTGQ